MDPLHNRAWATLEIKAVNDDERVIEGIASTPTPDRRGDVMEPAGAKFALPMPFLWQHDQDRPIGEVFEANATKSGIRIKARIATIDEPGKLKDRLDEAWQAIKAKLVRGLSIGWNPIEAAPLKSGGLHVLSWEWAELSAVTIPMNTEASILRIKQIDLAASGLHSPGDSGSFPVVYAVKAAPVMNTITEQISAFESTRHEKFTKWNAIQQKASSEGRTKDPAEREEFETLERELQSIDQELVDLRKMEKMSVANATPIVTKANEPATAGNLRGGQPPVITVKANVEKGTAFTRYVLAKINGQGSISDAIRYVEGRKDWMDQTPEVLLALKAAVNPGTTTEPAWAAPLAVAQPMRDEFLELLRPRTLLGKIPGLRKVPFNISMPIQTGGGTYRWVGEGAPKPVGNLQFTSANLLIAKAAGIIVISQELAKVSNPSAEQAVRNDMVKGMAAYLDQQFIDPTVAAVSGVSPASITNAAVSIGSAGSSAANAETDFKALVSSLISGNNGSVGSAVLIMSETNAFVLSLARTTNGDRMFPDLGPLGGNIAGVPVITSQVATTTVALVIPDEIMFADDGGIEIDVSREASVEMDTAPTSPPTASTITVSLWQMNLIGLKAERFINWKRARLSGVRYTTATYA